MPGCWRLRRSCFRPSVSCGAGNDALSSVATLFRTRRGGASIGQGIAAAGGSALRLATLANRQFSLFSSTLGLVERPDAAREKRSAVSGLVGHDHHPAAWIGGGGRDRNRNWSAHWCISAVQPRLRAASRISEGYSAAGGRARGYPVHGL